MILKLGKLLFFCWIALVIYQAYLETPCCVDTWIADEDIQRKKAF